ncbi:MAG: hydantoinase/oxoprolinase family protein [Dehalococcoidia bacterium]
MSLIVATDVGGTCTDTVVIRDGQQVFIGKSLSTPPDFARGVLDSIASAAEVMNLTVGELLSATSLFMHGSTVVDNALFERKGARTGLVTTRGFEDTLLVTRGAYGRWSGLAEEALKHPVATDRPTALVDPDCIVGVPERVDYKGAVVERLDEQAARAAVRHLVERQGVQAIAVSCLWGFANPVHEQRLRQLIEEAAPGVYVTLGSEIAPTPGEYERTSTTVINAYTGKVVRDYVTELGQLLKQHGYRGSLLVMQGNGGLLPEKEAAVRAVGMLECGPVAGVIGSQRLGAIMGDQNVIAADMGGTTFKVGIIQDGLLEYAREPLVDRFHYAVPKINVVSIGSGGGSIVHLEPGTRVPLVGPESAGANPGPVCYGQGGTEPTLTDVLLLIGYIDPDRFLRGTMRLDTDSARRVFEDKVARPLGMDLRAAAMGIFRVATSQMTDLIHKITVEQGLDPRDFVMHAFGGSCPMLASTLAAELNVRRLIVPYTASVNCAFGLASADVLHEYAAIETLVVPVSAARVNELFDSLAREAQSALRAEGFSGERIRLERSIGLRYSMQVHEVITPVAVTGALDAESLGRVVRDFEALYERRYGKGSAYRGAGIEMTRFRLTARGIIDKPDFEPLTLAGPDASAAYVRTRSVFLSGRNEFGDARVYDFDRLQPGNRLEGPAIIHTPITTIVVQDGQSAHLDPLRNTVIDIHP